MWIVPEWSLPVPVLTRSLISVPPCLFTMTNYEKTAVAKQEWFSPPFYSERGSYKFCLGVHPNGMETGKGTHISLNVYIMKGESDEHLKWPFYGEIQIQLVNWRDNTNHKDGTVVFDERAKVAGVSKKVTTDRATKGRGFPQYLAHGDLINTAKNIEYLRNDTLCFRVQEVTVKKT